MKRRNATRKALVASVVSLLLCVSMLVGATFAWFTDTVESANNIIKSGNLDIVLDYWDGDSWETVEGKSDILSEDLWEPGYVDVAYLRLKNAGSLALKYQLGVNIVSETAGVNKAEQSFLLSDYIYFDVIEGVNGETGAFADRAAAMAVATQDTKISAGYAKAATLEAGSEDLYLALVAHMPTTVGNEANHDGETVPQIDLGINVFATQADVEEDFFGADYDKFVLVNNAEELVAAVAEGGTVVLMDDITLAQTVKVENDVVLDLNGHDFVAESGSRPFQVYGGDLTIDATGSNVELDKYGLVDVREGDVKISIIGGTFTGELDNGAVIKGRANSKAEIYLKDINMSFTDSSVKGSYVYNPDKGASAETTIDGGVYNIDCGFVGNVTMKNATVNAKGFVFNGGGSIENSTITTDGSSKAPADAAPFCCVAASNNRTVTVKNSTLTATNCNAIEVYPTGGEVIVTGSTVTGACYKHPLYDANDKCSITIDGVEQ